MKGIKSGICDPSLLTDSKLYENEGMYRTTELMCTDPVLVTCVCWPFGKVTDI
ncbi:hypothetical protein Tco_0614347, partial [Tanacetum coccineum]